MTQNKFSNSVRDAILERKLTESLMHMSHTVDALKTVEVSTSFKRRTG